MRNLPERRIRFMRMRIAILYSIVLCAASAVLYTAHGLTVRDAAWLREKAEDHYNKQVHIPPKRGTIRDRNGAELAVTVDVDSLYANPRKLRASGYNPAVIAQQLAMLLGLDATKINERLSSDRYFVWLKRRITPKEGEAIGKLRIPGIEITKEPRRFYPGRELGAHVLGFANVDGKGIEGIELELDDRLRGSTRPVPAVRDRTGRIVFSEQLLDDRAAQGDDVVLTIDRTIQRTAERELELAVRTFEARGGAIVVMDPLTGDVLAMANFPTFNPNEPASSGPSHHRNRAVTDRYEPGSTIKPFTIAGGLSAGTTYPGQRIACEDGLLQLGDDRIRDTHKWLELTPAQILGYSSNIGTAKIGLSMGRERLYRTLRDFGFGASSEIGLPGETAGILRHYKKWYELDAATISFGQGMSATSVQLAAAFGALANRGQLMQPRIVKRFQGADGAVIEEPAPRVRRQVVAPRVARLVSDMLTTVTGEGGTGIEAAIDGYLVAGKTGTAQKADHIRGGYAEGKWSSSFVGFAPADKPRLVVSVTIDEPFIAHNGGQVAGPTFRRVMEASLRHMGVVATEVTVPVAKKKKRAPEPDIEAQDTDPAAAAAVAVASPVPAQPQRKPTDDEQIVPDFRGQGARGALVTAHKAGLSVRLRGSGVVVAQSPEPLAIIPRGGAIDVTLEPPAAPAAPKDTDSDELTSVASEPANTPELIAARNPEGRDG
jgi:cell division protein FtsI (penicillin-binding protein 3)